jgi:hypothetical protein
VSEDFRLHLLIEKLQGCECLCVGRRELTKKGVFVTGLLSRKSLLAGLIVLSSVVARAETKLGFVDVQKAIQATTAGKKAKETLDAEFGKRH